MDFSTVSRLIQSSGYTKSGTQSSFTNFNTLFSRGSEEITVEWELGGYVKSISVKKDSQNPPIYYSSAKDFIANPKPF